VDAIFERLLQLTDSTDIVLIVLVVYSLRKARPIIRSLQALPGLFEAVRRQHAAIGVILDAICDGKTEDAQTLRKAWQQPCACLDDLHGEPTARSGTDATETA